MYIRECGATMMWYTFRFDLIKVNIVHGSFIPATRNDHFDTIFY